MLNKKIKVLLIVIIIIISLSTMVYFDLENIVTKLGLSPTLWSAMIFSMFPIILTIKLWQTEKVERMEQIEKDVKLQKKLILRTAYINYFETFLEQVNEFIIFLNTYIISQNNLFGEKETKENKIRSLLGAILIEDDNKIWKIDYRKYAFKSIDIDIFNYKYKKENINIRAFMPYFGIVNDLNKISERKRLNITPSGVYLEALNDNDIFNVADKILKNKKVAEELVEFLEYLRKDIEAKINFNDEKDI